MTLDLSTWVAAGTVLVYYLVVWYLVGRDPKRGIIVVQYDPPASLSPAMLRYVWKEGFDDRTFWAGLLSLVAKGFATLQTEGDATLVRLNHSPKHDAALSNEERFLLDRVLRPRGRKGISTDLLDEATATNAWTMASVLRRRAIGRWFIENRGTVVVGALLSVAPVYLSARLQSAQQLLPVFYALVLIVPAAFHSIVLVPHLRDLFRACKAPWRTLLRRGLWVAAGLLGSLAGVIVGSVLLGTTFGGLVLFVGLVMLGLNVVFVHLMKAPTLEGRKLLDKIEGFRKFLSSVERYPMDRPDPPSRTPGLYERYLPYAVALEVEQAWSDQFIGAETLYEWEPWLGDYYLGNWQGRPVGIKLPSHHHTARQG